MTQCKWRRRTDGRWQCTECNRKVKSEAMPTASTCKKWTCPLAIRMPNPTVVYCLNTNLAEFSDPQTCALCKHKQDQVEQRTPPEINPDLIQRGLNFVQATMTHFASGMQQASFADQEARKAICKGGCAYWSTELQRCQHTKCGCSNMEAKWLWATSECPLKLWGSVPPEPDSPPSPPEASEQQQPPNQATTL